MKFLVLIQARCGSSRLPNKVMKKISGKTDLEWVLERVKRSKKIDEVMVITSIEKNNLPLIKLCIELDTRVFVGSEDDVLDRYYQAARLLQPEYVIRITADWHIIVKQHIQVWFSLPFTDLQQNPQYSVEKFSQDSFSIIELTYCVIHSDLAAPASIRNFPSI